MAERLGVGIIGCGVISSSYLSLAPKFAGVEMRACADVNAAAAQARADEFGIVAQSVDELLSNDDIDIVLNLTTPAAHVDILRRSLSAGRHVFSEKPFVLTLAEGHEIAAMAKAAGLRVGSAPDTFLGGTHQRARALIDEGAIGRVVTGTAHVMGRGMEHWHPNPDFFYLDGAGPILDIGPYYVTNLVQLLGPVKRVAAMSMTPSPERTISSAQRAGEKIPVETPTTLHAVLEFEMGAIITLGASWDVRQHGHSAMELYGTSGTLHLPDPNFFGGDLALTDGDSELTLVQAWPKGRIHPFGIENQHQNEGAVANYRTAGLADMAMAIHDDRPHRCSLELALHCVDVMTSILRSADTRSFVELETSCERPAPLDPAGAQALLT